MEQVIRDRYSDEIKAEVLKRFEIAEADLKPVGGFESFIYEYPRNGEATILRVSHSARYTQNVANATTAPDDPWCFGRDQSVWYAFTPLTNMRLEANTFGSGYDTSLSVYTGSRGALSQIGCSDDVGNVQQSRVRFAATAGTTYYFMASSRFSPAAPTNLVFNLQPAPPPFSFNPTVAQFGSVTPSTSIT